MSVQPASSPADELQRAADVLGKNLIIALPPAIASLLLGIVVVVGVISTVAAIVVGHAAAGPAGTLAGIGFGALIIGLLTIVCVFLVIFAQAIVIRAAEDAWQGRRIDLGASLGAVLSRLPDLLVAFFISLAIVLALCITVIGIPLVLVAAYFLMYVTAAVVNGGESGIGAISTSFRIAKDNFGPSIVAFIGIVVAAIVGNVANGLVSHVPLVNFIVWFVVGGLTAAYSALVSARFYDLLRGPAPFAASTASGMAPPPPMPPASSGGPPTIIR